MPNVAKPWGAFVMSPARRIERCLLILFSALIGCFTALASSSCASDGDNRATHRDAALDDGAPVDGAPVDGAPVDGAPDPVHPGPTISDFAASLPTLPAGGGSTTLSW